jgi:hypothetical protein
VRLAENSNKKLFCVKGVYGCFTTENSLLSSQTVC